MADTRELVAAYLARGGEVKRLNTMAPATGQIRGYIAEKRKKLEDEGVALDDMPAWCLTYQEKKERGLLPHQIKKRQREQAQLKKGGAVTCRSSTSQTSVLTRCRVKMFQP